MKVTSYVLAENLKTNKRWRSKRYRRKNTWTCLVPKPGPICLVEGDKGLVGFNKQNIEPIRLCWMNQMPIDSEKSIKIRNPGTI